MVEISGTRRAFPASKEHVEFQRQSGFPKEQFMKSVFAWTFVGLVSVAQAQDSLDPAQVERLQKLVDRMQADDAQVREAAQKELDKFLDGDPKAEWLKKAAESGDADLKDRIAALIKAYQRRKEGPNGPIVFWRLQKGAPPGDPASILYLFDKDQETVLVGNGACPTWSPDGKTVAYTRFSRGVHLLFAVNVDDQKPNLLTQDRINGGDFAWSPDGKKIAYATGQRGASIWTIDADGKTPAQLTHAQMMHSFPRWSPDGKKIAFSSLEPGGVCGISVMDGDGKNAKLIAKAGTGTPPVPVWFPDGKKIAFLSSKDGHVYEVDADGGDPKPMFGEKGPEGLPMWSPDGKRMAFIALREGNKELCIADAQGRNPKGLARSKNLASPCWSPDGTRLCFVSDADGEDALYVTDVEGKKMTKIASTQNRLSCFSASWGRGK